MVQDRNTTEVAQSFQQLVDTTLSILQREKTTEDEKLGSCFSRLVKEAQMLISNDADRSGQRIEGEFREFVAQVKAGWGADEQAELEKYSQSLAKLCATLEGDIETKINCLHAAVDQAKETHERINLFSILRLERQEDPQTYFLAWLLDPGGSHRLGDVVLTQFLERACAIGGNCQFNKLTTENTKVTPQQPAEDSGIPDIEIVGENFICVIENKVLAGETIRGGTFQTTSYADYYEKIARETAKALLLLYLVPNEAKRPKDPRFTQILYSDVVEVVKSALRTADPQPEVKWLVDMFLYNIKREICHQFDDYIEAKVLLGRPWDNFFYPDGYERLRKLTQNLQKEEESDR